MISAILTSRRAMFQSANNIISRFVRPIVPTSLTQDHDGTAEGNR